MKSATTRGLWRFFDALPRDVQDTAVAAFERWRADPRHPSLHYKAVRGRSDVVSARIGEGWRALGRIENDTVHWFWIGSHADYDRLLARR